MTTCYLSIDVEDWFHSHNLWGALDRDKWDEYELRVHRGTRTILDLLDEYDTTATFFVLGHVAERAPGLVSEIDDRGHEIASHGYNHRLLYEQDQNAVKEDITRSVDLLEAITTQEIRGYRAPSFSITEWAIDILDDLGFSYDSSHFAAPVHDRYGTLDVQSTTTFSTLREGFTEVQLPLVDATLTRIPWAGGGYFRFAPYFLFKRGIKRVLNNQDYVFYIHPWELDPHQPRITDIDLQYRVRHYTNLSRTERKFKRLLADFDWVPLGDGIREYQL